MDVQHKKIPVLTGEECSISNFRSCIQIEHTPVVLRGVPLGRCVDLWKSPDYLISKTENKDVKIHVSTDPKRMDFRTKNFKYCVCGLHDLIQRASESCEQGNADHFYIDSKEKYYLRSTGNDPRGKETVLFQKDFPNLAEDFILPEFFDQENLFSSVLRISSPGIRVWTHYDVMDNLYAQIVGRKKAVMWAPNEASNMYLEGDKSKVVDIDDHKRNNVDFPKFCKAKQWTCDLIPGDLLYIPALWFHNMTAIDYGVAINVFWKNLDTSLYDKKDPYGNKDLLPAAKSLRMLDNVIKQLEQLPLEYKDFYARQLIAKIEKKCCQNEN
jgi:tRNA wybutosine-synthesizing protein 5